MLRYMERSTIYYLKQKGWSNVQIAEFTGHHRDTVARVLREEVDKKPKTRERTSRVAVFDAQIAEWLDENLSVIRMLELARANADHPYAGKDTAFYDDVRKIRRVRKQAPGNLALRFEGVPGEFLPIDWGEVRGLELSKEAMEPQTRYFFAARLKYSRSMYVSFHTDMREETLLRCLIACFAEIDGVPWAVVTDHMKTAVLGRDEQNQPIWNPAYQKLAVEFKFHPDVCAPASGNQKGAVENLVKFVKGNFLPGRTFYDDSDLTARIHTKQIELFADQELVAIHVRLPAQNARVIDPAHFEAAFVGKPRGRVMVYRDWLCSLSPVVMSYVHEISHKRRKAMNQQMIALYELAQEIGKADFIAALELAAEQQMYGAEYLRAIVALPSA